eukprot:PITA_12843
MEESRNSGSIYHAINTTFLALILKSDSPSSFDDYRPISLRNCLYKIISKTIASQLKPILSRHIAPQQFAFLESRQIHEAIHSIWSKHLKSILLKIDLSKDFDRANWFYIKMILIHLGFPHSYISWIMACITSPSFSILINGSASPFFHSERGLRQGCPLSPLLFLLIMEGLSCLIDSTKRTGDIWGLRISEFFSLTHLLFVDDVLILMDGSIHNTISFSKILLLFSSATGMLANQSKSTITCSHTSVQESFFAQQDFPYSIHPLDRGLQYLGYWLKPISQRIDDWVWLVTKLEKRLNLCNRYLWNGNQDKRLFAWISWQKITLPKKWGGWGLKDLPAFAQALSAKMGWTLMTSQNLWAHVSYHKYIWPQRLLDWIRLPSWQSKGCSSIWKALIHSLPLIRDNLVWRINDGSLGRIGLDPWIGSGGRYILSRELIRLLNAREIKVFADIADQQRTDIFSQAWKTARHLDLPPQWHMEWDNFISALSESHIRIKQGSDELVWCMADNGIYAPKQGYNTLIMHKKHDSLCN